MVGTGIVLKVPAARIPPSDRCRFSPYVWGLIGQPLPRCPHTVTAHPRACQRPTRLNRITAPHVVPIETPVQLSARLLATPTPRGYAL